MLPHRFLPSLLSWVGRGSVNIYTARTADPEVAKGGIRYHIRSCSATKGVDQGDSLAVCWEQSSLDVFSGPRSLVLLYFGQELRFRAGAAAGNPLVFWVRGAAVAGLPRGQAALCAHRFFAGSFNAVIVCFS